MRPTLRYLTCAWLVCQLAGFVAAPIAVCASPASANADSHENCCVGSEPGQACPMHRSPKGDKDCVMRNACAPSPSILLTLLGGLGLLPPPSSTLAALVVSDLPPGDPSVGIARAELPEPPPPRA